MTNALFINFYLASAVEMVGERGGKDLDDE